VSVVLDRLVEQQDVTHDLPADITYSLMAVAKDCPRKLYLRYVRCLDLKNKKPSLTLGSAVHKFVETGDIDQALALYDDVLPQTPEQADRMAIDMATVQAIAEQYPRFYRPLDIRPEVKFRVPILNPDTGAKSRRFHLSGKADGIVLDDGKWWLFELKTASQITETYIERLRLNLQITTYIYALQRQFGIHFEGVIYRIIRKPQIKQRRDESLQQFCERIKEDYRQRPEWYFVEQTVTRTQDDLDQFERELWHFTQVLLFRRRNDFWERNTSKCGEWGGCAFIPICLGYEGAEAFYDIVPPNVELEDYNEGVEIHGLA